LSVNPINPYQGPSLEELEAPKKQTSLDGEELRAFEVKISYLLTYDESPSFLSPLSLALSLSVKKARQSKL
jgi:hypothetical protein